ncbi:UNVERIFIED_CONTAM: hypothetical protein FKN15_043587 [Acipenser sinensis]
MPDSALFKLTGKGADQEPKGIFYINKKTGEVLVSRSLDRERIAFYHMQVETTDLSGKTLEGPVDVEVAIIDQNDNRPIFKGGPHMGEILEGSPTVWYYSFSKRSAVVFSGAVEINCFE